MMTTASMLFLFVVGLAQIPVSAQEDYKSTPFGPCKLHCQNGGICEYVEDDVRAIGRVAQSGRLTQRCTCPPGWGGVGCEIPVEECVQGVCSRSGMPCDTLGRYDSCACHIADRVDSTFAGPACRRGYTEYCSGRYDPEGPLFFCTNGGKCRADFIAAQLDPGNTQVNFEYMDAGCVCNENFYGPQCEFLRFGEEHLDDPDATTAVDSEVRTNGQTFVENTTDEDDESEPELGAVIAVLFSVVALLFMILVYLFYRRYNRFWRARRTQRKDQPAQSESNNLVAPSPGSAGLMVAAPRGPAGDPWANIDPPMVSFSTTSDPSPFRDAFEDESSAVFYRRPGNAYTSDTAANTSNTSPVPMTESSSSYSDNSQMQPFPNTTSTETPATEDAVFEEVDIGSTCSASRSSRSARSASRKKSRRQRSYLVEDGEVEAETSGTFVNAALLDKNDDPPASDTSSVDKTRFFL